ncbi:FkbM family methyltransferase [Vallitalea maricola]|uniref:FkbM family methyltransferase n=1 Tax=Vallitalea maricola TaxID=3074433 RepID=A0ACB5UL80_9FIRM|nr:FkbM family methyltransferase [Vallitalea sp. AN17-2]
MKSSEKIYSHKLLTLLTKTCNLKKYEFDKEPFILYGAGLLGEKTLEGLTTLGIKPLAIGDSSPSQSRLFKKGIEVLSINQLIESYGNDVLVVISIWSASYGEKARVKTIINNLNNLGFKNVVDITKLYNQYPSVFLPHYCLDIPSKIIDEKDKILKAFDLLKDIKSQKEYYNQIKWRLYHNNWDEFIKVDYPQYFEHDIYKLKDDDIIYDCGAYDGDTIKQIIKESKNRFTKIIAFEPDPNNYKKIIRFVSTKDDEFKKRVNVFECAVGDKDGALLFQSNNDESSLIVKEGNCKVKSITINDFVKTKKYDPPTIIKMDIEGFEFKALLGAKKVIKNFKPILAISVYHNQSDLWEIPLLIYSMNNQYSFYLRQYTGDCWDTVLYAIPENRALKNLCNII